MRRLDDDEAPEQLARADRSSTSFLAWNTRRKPATTQEHATTLTRAFDASIPWDVIALQELTHDHEYDETIRTVDSHAITDACRRVLFTAIGCLTYAKSIIHQG